MPAEQKTEKATPKRRRDERKKGNIFKSNDAVSVLVMLSSFFVIWLTAPMIAENIYDFFVYCMNIPTDQPVSSTAPELRNMIDKFITTFAVSAGPIIITAITVGVGSTLYQTKMLVTFEPIKPKLSHLNPLQGIKRLFSIRSVVDAVKGILKIVIILSLLYRYIGSVAELLSKYMYTDLLSSASHLYGSAFEVVIQISIAFVVLAGADIYFQWWDYERKLKMSKQEVKEEYKQMEGDPKIKAKIKEAQRNLARSRMMQKVPTADVVVRNPTHFAVALRYRSESDAAPIVLAKGQDELALRIIAVAEENNVLIVENVPLARALYASTELDREIPSELYNAVAEVLVYLYRLDGRIKN